MPVFDIHTHLYAPIPSNLVSVGIDELLTYHDLVAESFRYLQMPYEAFWELGKSKQVDLIWQQLFVLHSPISESAMEPSEIEREVKALLGGAFENFVTY